ncbi:hypothetical protein CC78DRAFT_597568 [Lojkania enalia]|uniref:FAD linked oxidase N-terminal domain-containing protein n=1 Tax=Lojkania enalia TaxID=147567 RepID=A0A9P4KBF2_9PLEO|nr:hypothetical protein CC78DRAFT_597568 [Didymosphaeria enalia]
MDTHRFNVREITKHIQAFYKKKRLFRVCHEGAHSTQAMHNLRVVVDIGDLNYILDIKVASRFAMVELNASIEKLVKEALKHNLMPPVVPAFTRTTVGGAFASTTGASSSFKHGFFDRAVTWLKILLPDGNITRVSRQ